MRRASKRWIVVLLGSGAAVFIAALFAVLPRDRSAPKRDAAVIREDAADGYAEASACANCHAKIADTYALTGMARSFARVGSGRSSLGTAARLYHKASNRHYTMLQRDGRFYQRRHEIGFDGTETNAIEVEGHYVIGSGNHAQTFLHRNTDGRLFEMPVSWYSEQGRREKGERSGYWAMSPGYDKSVHQDFRRLISQDCMSCHNGYPRALVTDDGNGPVFTGALPEGIDCQRCHGPGQAHIDAIQSEDVDAGRQTIVNPGRFDRERQLEACMQCHLESTSGPLPFRIRRYERPPFSYVPGKPLGDYFIHFDHAAGAGREDKFEIAGAAYRLRKSACFQRSEMTCLTCHDPHDIPRGAEAVQRYVAICQSCHQGTHRSGMPRAPDVGARRHVSRLPYAQAPHRGCRSRRHDRSLHSAASTGGRPAGAARGTGQLRVSRRGRALLPATARVDARERAVSGPCAGSTGSQPRRWYPSTRARDRAAPADTARHLLRARTRVRAERRTLPPSSAGARRHSHATAPSFQRSRSLPRPP